MTTIYTGRTSHLRSRPNTHRFDLDLAMVLFDADEVGGPTTQLTCAPGQVIDRRDLLDGATDTSLGDAVRDLVEQRTGSRPRGPVRTLCIARAAGYVFNPLTVHWAMSADDGLPEVVVLEVTNTPWKERQFYVLDARIDAPAATAGTGRIVATRSADGTIAAEFAKEMHVSPFGRMDERYEATVSSPGPRISVQLRNLAADGRPVMQALLDLRAEPGTTRRRRPWFSTRRVWLAIHWQALRLFCKRVPVQRHPDKRTGAGPRRQS